MLAQMAELDRETDSDGLEEEGWALCYHLEELLLQIANMEEEYWR